MTAQELAEDHGLGDMTPEGVAGEFLATLEELTPDDRVEVLTRLTNEYCPFCGELQLCDCHGHEGGNPA